jgi:hypothetical protein
MVVELLLGDNPFIGVSHYSQEKARDERGSASTTRKVEVIKAALEGGATGFTFSTHESNLELLKYVRNNHTGLLDSLNYYILTPYAQGYVRRANVLGMEGLAKTLLGRVIGNDPPYFIKAVLTLNVGKVANLFVAGEVSPYLEVLPERRVKAILLHEVLTELIIAFDMTRLLREIKEYVESRLGVGFGIETRNASIARDFLMRRDVAVDYLMTPLNPLGYQMAVSREEAEQAIVDLASAGVKIIAINVLASGATTLDDSIEYLRRFRNSLYAVTSASINPERILRNFKELKSRLCS